MAARKEAQAQGRVWREGAVLGIPCWGGGLCLTPEDAALAASDMLSLLAAVGREARVPFNVDLKTNSPAPISFLATSLHYTLP